MVKTYRVIFLGLLESRERFVSAMAKMGVSRETAEEILLKAPVVLKGGLRLAGARQYADAIQRAGGRVSIQEHGMSEKPARMDKALDIKPFDDFVMCPECGCKQLRSKTCVKCGFVLP